jgi:HSP20 family protein
MFALDLLKNGFNSNFWQVSDSYTTSDDDNITLELPLPGLDTESLNLQFDKNILTINAERSSTLNKQLHGKIKEQFKVTTDVDTDNIDANYKNGMLTVTLPKKHKSNLKQIPISIS